MKLLRYGSVGRERPGILDCDGVVRDLRIVVDDIDGAALSPMGLARLRALDLRSLPKVCDHGRLGACVSFDRCRAGISRFSIIGTGAAGSAAVESTVGRARPRGARAHQRDEPDRPFVRIGYSRRTRSARRPGNDCEVRSGRSFSKVLLYPFEPLTRAHRASASMRNRRLLFNGPAAAGETSRVSIGG
jgi:hypothetical protein